MRMLLLLALVLGTGEACSCARLDYRRHVCEMPHIVRVKPLELLNKGARGADRLPEFHEKEDWWDIFSEAPTLPIPVNTDFRDAWINGKTTIRAGVTHVYRGDLKLGHVMELTTLNMDSMCGIGDLLYDLDRDQLREEELVIATWNSETTELGLCGFVFFVGGWGHRRLTEEVEQVLEKHDCSCAPRDCRLRVGKQVYKGNCHERSAYCARDERNRCRWNASTGSLSISMCRYEWA